MSKNTGDGELDLALGKIYAKILPPVNEKTTEFPKNGIISGVQLVGKEDAKAAIKKYAAQEANKAQRQLLQGLMEELPSGEVDLIKFERDKTGWIEEVGVDPETLTDKDMIAVWQLARHFKQQAIKELKVIQNKLEGLS